jgi:hypothetical protein
MAACDIGFRSNYDTPGTRVSGVFCFLRLVAGGGEVLENGWQGCDVA